MVDLKALIEAAKAATPGPWEVGVAGDYPPNVMLDSDHTPIHSDTWGAFVSVVTNIDRGGGRVGTSKQGVANATFIALANPSTVAAMAEELMAAREALKPFAALGQYLIDEDLQTKPDGRAIWGFDRHELTYGDFRRAAKAAKAGAGDV